VTHLRQVIRQLAGQSLALGLGSLRKSEDENSVRGAHLYLGGLVELERDAAEAVHLDAADRHDTGCDRTDTGGYQEHGCGKRHGEAAGERPRLSSNVPARQTHRKIRDRARTPAGSRGFGAQV
jgi:hypothetical protein